MLDRVRIASPCTADWEQMIGDDRVRFCSQCNLNVYNLSAMTRPEAEELIANREGRLCTRFYRRVDGTVLTRDCPVGLRAVVRRISRVAGAALSAMMSVSFAAAQNPASKTPAQPLVQITPASEIGIVLTVVDQSGAVIPNAKVRLASKSGKNEIHGTADAIGIYKSAGLAAGPYELSVEARGFTAYKAPLLLKQAERQVQQITLMVDPHQEIMGTCAGDPIVIEPIPANINLTPKLRRKR